MKRKEQEASFELQTLLLMYMHNIRDEQIGEISCWLEARYLNN